MKFAAAIKVAVIGALALALLVPVAMIQGLVAERQMRRNEAVSGIAEGWGRQQVLAGPYLAIPYDVTRVEVAHETIDGREREKRTERVEHHVRRITMDSVDWTFDAAVTEKARGIYKARLYGLQAQVQGRISVPAGFGIAESGGQVRIGTPLLVFGVADPRGIRSISALSLDAARHAFKAGSGDPQSAGSGLHVPLPALSVSP
jgi:inner membrane protein